MAERTVGIRELKSNLSACLRRVKGGETIVITERGIPVGRMSPMEVPLEEKLQVGAKSHLWAWNGKKWRPAQPKIKNQGKVLVSDLLLDDRE